MKNILVILILIVSGINVSAQDSFQKELFSANLVLKYRSEIKLSTEKVDNVKKIYNAHITEFNSLKWDLDAELYALNKNLSDSHVDEATSMAQMEKVMDLESKLKRIRLGMLIKIKNELSQSQQEMLKNLRTEIDENELSMITPINENPRVMIKVDGANSSGKPLYIIVDKNGERRVQTVEGINPEDIASMEVLKNEKATEKYGADGKNGVIILRLKD